MLPTPPVVFPHTTSIGESSVSEFEEVFGISMPQKEQAHDEPSIVDQDITQIIEAIAEVHKHLQSNESSIIKLQHDSIFSLADKVAALRELKESLAEITKTLNIQVDDREKELGRELLEEETTLKRRGYSFYPTTKLYVTPTGGSSSPELFEALRTNGYENLVRETVNANTLRATVKELQSENEGIIPDWIEPLIKVSEITTVGVRRSS